MYIHGYLHDPQGLGEDGVINSIMASPEVTSWKFYPPQTHMKFPHFVQYALTELQGIKQLTGKIYSGLDVYTTLDPALQIARPEHSLGADFSAWPLPRDRRSPGIHGPEAQLLRLYSRDGWKRRLLQRFNQRSDQYG